VGTSKAVPRAEERSGAPGFDTAIGSLQERRSSQSLMDTAQHRPCHRARCALSASATGNIAQRHCTTGTVCSQWRNLQLASLRLASAGALMLVLRC
jgi:hypothetical protein